MTREDVITRNKEHLEPLETMIYPQVDGVTPSLIVRPEPCEDGKGCSNCIYSGRPTYKSPCSECRDNSQWEMKQSEPCEDTYGYIAIETLLDFCENSKDHAVTPNDFMRMKRVRKPEPHWIPVTKRLPEDDTVVLVCGKGGGVYTAIHNNSKTWIRGWWKMNSKNHHCNPIAWMPLPKPYKEVRE